MTKCKYSIIQTEQNTTDVDKIQIEQYAKFQNTNTTEYKRTKYKLPKYKCDKKQMQENTNGTKYICKNVKIQTRQNTKEQNTNCQNTNVT